MGGDGRAFGRLRSRAQASPLLEFQHLEILAGKNSMTRNPLLPRMARAAFAAGEWARAKDLATEALEAAQRTCYDATKSGARTGSGQAS